MLKPEDGFTRLAIGLLVFEAYYSGRSRDYEFGIFQVDLKKKGKKEEGTSALIYAAKIKLLDGKRLDVESYGIEPIRLLGVRKL